MRKEHKLLKNESTLNRYIRYFSASFGSSFIAAVYGLVDVAMVGNYHGPTGAAAMAVIAPIWNIIFSLGLLAGIGGSVLYGTAKGRGDERSANEVFTVSVLFTLLIAGAAWILIVWKRNALLYLFGADEELLSLAVQYVSALICVFPCYLLSQMLTCFLRNDNDPMLATVACIVGGVCNIGGDYVLVFVLDMGIRGAGIATSAASVLSLLVTMVHFLKKSNTLRLVRPKLFFPRVRRICVLGFSSFFVDIAMGILTVLFNRQIMLFAGTDALAVYGVIVNTCTFVQCCAYSIGQAAQPMISFAVGAEDGPTVRHTLRYAVVTAAAFGVVWTVLSLLFPNTLVRLFMVPTDTVLAIAPPIIRVYALSFLLLPFNIMSTYYFQSVLHPVDSFVVSIGRGAVISGALILLLPRLFTPFAMWTAMPITELVVFFYAVRAIRRSLQDLPAHNKEERPGLTPQDTGRETAL